MPGIPGFAAAAVRGTCSSEGPVKGRRFLRRLLHQRHSDWATCGPRVHVRYGTRQRKRRWRRPRARARSRRWRRTGGLAAVGAAAAAGGRGGSTAGGAEGRGLHRGGTGAVGFAAAEGAERACSDASGRKERCTAWWWEGTRWREGTRRREGTRCLRFQTRTRTRTRWWRARRQLPKDAAPLQRRSHAAVEGEAC